MSRGKSAGGLPPDNCVEKEADILADAERLICTYHDPQRHAMMRLVLAACSPFSVTPDLMREAARLPRAYPGVRLNARLAEELDEERYRCEICGMRSVAIRASLGWLGEDV